MRRIVISFMAGISLGAASSWYAIRSSPPTSSARDQGCAEQLEKLRGSITDLETKLAGVKAAAEPEQLGSGEAVRASSAGAPLPAPSPADEPALADSKPTPSPNAVKWRVSAIEKFVPLTEDQRQRLVTKFEADLRGEEGTETLEDVLGEENARFYREQVKAAFRKVEEEELDKEVVWLSRQLDLSPEQERRLHEAFAGIETEIDAGKESLHGGARSSEDRVRAMIEESRTRQRLRSERARAILNPDQFDVFSRVQAESSSSNMEVFHEP
jgi:hypothetical protein